VELYLVSLKRRILQEGAASFGIPLFFHQDSSSHLSSDRVHDVLQFLSNLARCWHRQVRTEGFLYEGTMFFVEKEKKRSLLRWCESKSILPWTAYCLRNPPLHGNDPDDTRCTTATSGCHR
jgi:hypothetical protein